MIDFVHLHLHTEYSLLDGLSKIRVLTKHIRENGMNSVAITDHGAMYGAIEFYKLVKDAGLKPIIGVEAYTTNVKHTERIERSKIQNFHLLLLAKNLEGYKNLMKLISIAHLEGYYYRPRFDRETLGKYSGGLVCTSACGLGELAQAFVNESYQKAKEIAEWYLNLFGEDYYLEIQRHYYDSFATSTQNQEIKNSLYTMAKNEKITNDGVLKLSRELGIPIVATNDAHYIKKEDATAQDALVCIATGKNVSDIKRLRFIDSPSFWVTTPGQMQELFPDLPDALENSLKIADKCNVEFVLGQWYFPEIEIKDGKKPEEILKDKAQNSLKEKFKKVDKELTDRLEKELEVICKKGYAPYFLIYEDMAQWAKSRQIPINTRGSVAGSLVSFCLGITTIDPIKYVLPFERFLNPFRPSAPDIDIDIADDRREEMIDYLKEKYGKNRVGQICTFGRMLAKASVRDIARVLGFPYSTGDKIAKLTPLGSQGFPMTIERALKDSPELSALYKMDKDAKVIVDLARQIEGNARHVSVHAAGIVIAPKELTEFTPIQYEPNGTKIITQYEMHSCEEIGLVKLDVLGIRNLSILRGAVELARINRTISIDLVKIPLDDKKTFEMLSRGETMGTFQLSGSGMTRYLVELKPERIEDIMAMIALFRPGPIANIPEYIARKKGEKKVTYYHPKMEKFLDKSFGILVYQDDLLFTALEMAGYTWETVDKFRKAVGKKIPEEMAKQHDIFVEGCIKHSSMTKKEAEGLWKLFEPFQGYGFNKAHAASYGMVAYQTSYMKANFPVEYMTALLTAEAKDTDKVSAAINECKRMGIRVLPPDINESSVGFNIEKVENGEEAIRFGLDAIKNVGKAAIEAVLEERSKSKFTSFVDLVRRVDGRRVNKKVLESLIKVGALSKFGNRASLLYSIDTIRDKYRLKSNSPQQGLFGDDLDKIAGPKDFIFPDVDEFNEEELQSFEKQLLGFSLTGKSIFELLGNLEKFATHKINQIEASKNSYNLKIAGLVTDMRVVFTKRKGDEMAFAKVEDDTGTIEVVIFPKVYKTYREVLVSRKPLLVSGKLDTREETPVVLVDSLFLEGETIENNFFIRIPKKASVEKLTSLKNLLLKNPGHTQVILKFEEKNKEYMLPIKVSWTESLARSISDLLEREDLS
ncbi:DNA polymerase III subunit alpha [Candidatus Woesebacteria bacterium RIFCSPLOWO2_01_FULL_39_21]|uniref:DNA polymerase III subunit alpha n=1 Tax=Candidatus Woesebacteria bacterium RIFCSPLOWO2_01_FULL_39_21 TaxID=1802519 RepID=A0A1F8BBZ8_9BACT|nr:MAG: DNA polymerase III subunit alpha [Candidatus Woesebacteria bacterium RIFCSPHIGHO2_01_FULL_39_23]OGM61576.1 MAG: DNA polymerase III subunit alpha [Candidatus Woesebacteria bacterium RIFCSPLOWO2_01_FULL_39_21]